MVVETFPLHLLLLGHVFGHTLSICQVWMAQIAWITQCLAPSYRKHTDNLEENDHHSCTEAFVRTLGTERERLAIIVQVNPFMPGVPVESVI